MGLKKIKGYKDSKHFATEVRKTLQGTPFNLSKPIPLSFFLYLPTRKIANLVRKDLKTKGFDVKVEPSATKDGTWLCWCDLDVIPTLKRLEQIGSIFRLLAATHNGSFDGWETNRYKAQRVLVSQMLEQLSGKKKKSNKA